MKGPKLRFKKYNDEPKSYKLNEITNRVTRKNKENPSDIPLTISSLDGLVDQRDYFNKTVASKDMSNYYQLHRGEFAYNKSYSNGFPVGSIKRLEKYPSGALSTLYICFKNKDNVDPCYLKWYFESDKWHKEISMITTEGARNHGLLNVSPNDFFETLHYLVPDLEEQKRIADFLTTVDDKIKSLKEKLESLELLKKELLRQIFSREIRFKDENGNDFPEWKNTCLYDLTEEFRIKTKEDDEDVLLSCTIDGIFLNSEIFSHQRGESNKGYLKIKPNTLVLSAQNLHLGNANVNTKYESGIVSPAYKTFDLINCDPEFMAAWLKSPNTNNFFFKATTTGASICRRNVDWDLLFKQPLLFPELKEQEKIADFFNKIQIKINTLINKLNTWLKIKKGLLQQLFPN